MQSDFLVSYPRHSIGRRSAEMQSVYPAAAGDWAETMVNKNSLWIRIFSKNTKSPTNDGKELFEIETLSEAVNPALDMSPHHHHVVPLARIPLTLSRHFSRSFIVSGRSSGLHPVSLHSCWMYVRAGCPVS